MEELTLAYAREHGLFEKLAARIVGDDRDVPPDHGNVNHRLRGETRRALLRANLKFAWQIAQIRPPRIRGLRNDDRPEPPRKGSETSLMKGIPWSWRTDVSPLGLQHGLTYAPELWAALVDSILPSDLSTKVILNFPFSEPDTLPTEAELRDWARNLERAMAILDYAEVVIASGQETVIADPARRMLLPLKIARGTTAVTSAMINEKIADLGARRHAILDAFKATGFKRNPYDTVANAVAAYRQPLFTDAP